MHKLISSFNLALLVCLLHLFGLSECRIQPLEDICSTWTSAYATSCNFYAYDPFVMTWTYMDPQVDFNTSFTYCGWCARYNGCRNRNACPQSDGAPPWSVCSMWSIALRNDGSSLDMNCNQYSYHTPSASWSQNNNGYFGSNYTRCGWCRSTNSCMTTSQLSRQCSGYSGPCSSLTASYNGESYSYYCPDLGTWEYRCNPKCMNVSSGSDNCTRCRWCPGLNKAVTDVALCSADLCSAWTRPYSCAQIICNTTFATFSTLNSCVVSCQGGTCQTCAFCNSSKTCMSLDVLSAATCPGWTSNCSAFDDPEIAFYCSYQYSWCTGATPKNVYSYTQRPCDSCFVCPATRKCLPQSSLGTCASATNNQCAATTYWYTCNNNFFCDRLSYLFSDMTSCSKACDQGRCISCGWCNSTSSCMRMSDVVSKCPGATSVCSIFDANVNDPSGSYCWSNIVCDTNGILHRDTNSFSANASCTRCALCPSTLQCMEQSAMSTTTCKSYLSVCSTLIDPSICATCSYCPIGNYYSYSTCVPGASVTCMWCPSNGGSCMQNTTVRTACAAFIPVADFCKSLTVQWMCTSWFICGGSVVSYNKWPTGCTGCTWCYATTQCMSQDVANVTCPRWSSVCSLMNNDSSACNANAYCSGTMDIATYCDQARCGANSSCMACAYCNATGECYSVGSQLDSAYVPYVPPTTPSPPFAPPSTGIPTTMRPATTIPAVLPINSGTAKCASDRRIDPCTSMPADSCNFNSYCPLTNRWQGSSQCSYSCGATPCISCQFCRSTAKCMLNTSVRLQCPDNIDPCGAVDPLNCIPRDDYYESVAFCASTGTLINGGGERWATSSKVSTVKRTLHEQEALYTYACNACPGKCLPCFYCPERRMCLTVPSIQKMCPGTSTCSLLRSLEQCNMHAVSNEGEISNTCGRDYGPANCTKCHFCETPNSYRGSCKALNTSCYSESATESKDVSTTVSSSAQLYASVSKFSNTKTVSVTATSASATRTPTGGSSERTATPDPSFSQSTTGTATASITWVSPSRTKTVLPFPTPTLGLTATHGLSATHTRVIPKPAEPKVIAAAVIEVAASTVTAMASSASLAAGGAAATDAQALAILGSISCSADKTKNGAGSSDSPTMYFLSPFYPLGVAAMTLGNIGVVGLVFAMQLALVHCGSDEGKLQRKVRFRFPAISYFAVGFLHPGTCFGAFHCLFAPEGRRPLEVFAGVVGVLWIVATAIGPPLFIVRNIESVAIFKPYEFSKPWSYLAPIGHWGPEEVVGQFGKLFGASNGGGRINKLLVAVPLHVTTLVAFIASFKLEATACAMQLGFVAAVYIIAGITMIVMRPMRSHVTSVLAAGSFTLLGLLALSTSLQSPEWVATFTFLQLTVVLTRAAYDGIILILEQLIWPNRRGVDGKDISALDVILAPLLDAPTAAPAPTTVQSMEAPQLPVGEDSVELTEIPPTKQTDDATLPKGCEIHEFQNVIDPDDLFFASLEATEVVSELQVEVVENGTVEAYSIMLEGRSRGIQSQLFGGPQRPLSPDGADAVQVKEDAPVVLSDSDDEPPPPPPPEDDLL